MKSVNLNNSEVVLDKYTILNTVKECMMNYC